MTQHQVRHQPEVSVETNTVYFSVVKEDGPQPVRERLDEGLAREGPEQLTNADDAPAAHQPGSTSHSKGFAEKGADASGAEPTKEASVIEVDTSVDDEVGPFQRKIDAVTKTRRFVISKNSVNLCAFCNVCSVKMVAGKEHKGQDRRQSCNQSLRAFWSAGLMKRGESGSFRVPDSPPSGSAKDVYPPVVVFFCCIFDTSLFFHPTIYFNLISG